MRVTSGDHPDGVFWTKSGQFGPSDDHFRGQKTIYIKDYFGPQNGLFANEMALWAIPKSKCKNNGKIFTFW